MVKLVWRNTLRHPLRAALTVVGLAVAVLAFCLLRTVVDAWYAGVAASSPLRLVTRNLRLGIGDATVLDSLAKASARYVSIASLKVSKQEKVESAVPILELCQVSTQGEGLEPSLTDINLQVHAGEIVGIYGLMGAGRSELARILFGLEPYDRGEIQLAGAPLRRDSTGRRIQRGLAFLTENVDGSIDLFEFALCRIVYDLRPGFVGFSQRDRVGMARTTIATQRLIGHLGDMRAAHHHACSSRPEVGR